MILNRDRYTVTVNGQERELTYLPFKILEVLVEANGKVVGAAEIEEKVWHDTPEMGLHFNYYQKVRVHISHLRKVLAPEVQIRNRVGIGYQLVGEIERERTNS